MYATHFIALSGACMTAAQEASKLQKYSFLNNLICKFTKYFERTSHQAQIFNQACSKENEDQPSVFTI